MSRKLAVFRADASPQIGTGHLRRCLVLAKMLAKEGWSVVFASNKGAREAAGGPEGGRFEWIDVEGADDIDSWRGCFSTCDLIVFDHYGIDRQTETAARGWAGQIMAIDDLADRKHDCDILLDQTADRNGAVYAGLVPPECVVLAGSAYALLDPSFSHFRSMKRAVPKGSLRVFVGFGGIDRSGATILALRGLAAADCRLDVEVAIGALSTGLDEVRSAATGLEPPAQVHVDADNMAELMHRADFAIGAGGVSALERACLGLPTLLLALADNQLDNCRALDRKSAAVFLGHICDATVETVAGAVKELATDATKRKKMTEAARALCDGLGAQRVARLLASAA